MVRAGGVHMRVYLHTHMDTNMHTHMDTCIHTYTHMYTRTYTYTHARVHAEKSDSAVMRIVLLRHLLYMRVFNNHTSQQARQPLGGTHNLLPQRIIVTICSKCMCSVLWWKIYAVANTIACIDAHIRTHVSLHTPTHSHSRTQTPAQHYCNTCIL